MKNKTGKVLFFLLLICSSCTSIHQFSIDVQEPALVTLPVSAQNVLIIDNIITQPNDYGIDRTYEGVSLQTYPLSMDSLVWSAIAEIAAVLNESHFFNTIAVYQKSLRKDTQWLSRSYLTPEIQSAFYDIDNYDALLVIDRLAFSLKESVKTIRTGGLFADDPTAFVDLRTDGMLSCTMYSYGNEKPVSSFTVFDSLFTKSTVENDSMFLFKKIPEFMLHELSSTMGNKAAKRFIPTWKTEERMLYLGYNSRMQEATGYASNHQWADAESIWIAEMGKKTKPVDKAKIAYNVAVANEMQDKMEPALRWAKNAKDYWKNANQDKYSQEIGLTDKYITELEQRIRNNRLLDLQWGKE